MTSYLRYKSQMTVQDADDIESWITVRGNHIPIKKGQSKEDAVKSFLENKGNKEKKQGYTEKYSSAAGERDKIIKQLKNKDLSAQERYNLERKKNSLEKTMVSEGKKNAEIRETARREENVKNTVGKNWSGKWKERGNKPVSLGEATKKATQISYSLNQKAKKEANYTALEIAYNDVPFTKSSKQNKADLLKAVSKSGAEHSEYMTQTINNMPETAFESINSFKNGLKDSSKWSPSWFKRANKPQTLGTALKNTMNIVSEQRTIGKINKKADK